MSETPPLSRLANETEVSNVVVFVADSVRFDALSETIGERGVTARTVSASTFTASSLPSMMTGTYPSTHRVWNFQDTVSSSPELLAGENRGLTTQHVWQDLEPERRPPLRTLRLGAETALEDVDSPFTLVVHDRGAHGPYDYCNSDYEDSGAFFRDFADRPEALRERYYSGAEAAAERFFDLVDRVTNRVDQAETLFVFTSDHGELLGERERGGFFAHGSPICPELVDVPTVFLGAGLPEGERLDCLLSGTDLAPTLLGAQDRPIPDYVEGVDCWNGAPDDDRTVRSEIWANTGALEYGACSAWDRNGGVVDHRGRAHKRVAFAVHRKLHAGAQAPANRSWSIRQYANLIRTYGKSRIVYGSPDVASLEGATDVAFERGATDYAVDSPSQEQLEALGYVE